MNRYPSYKDSGVEWFSRVPTNWKVVRIGSVFEERKETVSDSDYTPLSVSKGGIVPQMEGVAKTDNNDSRKLVLKGDFVINSRSDRKGSSGYSELDGSVSVINIVLKPINIYPKYTHHLFKSYLFIEEFFRNGKGIVMDLWSTRYNEMKYMLIPLPPLSEQKQIVSYLDEKTSLIDSLIQSKQKKITLLKEKRTSLINQIVTKGLNPNVEMKDSGVEWIGEIPSRWSISRVKHYFNLLSGFPFPSESISKEETEYPLIRIGNVSSGEIDVFYDGEPNDKMTVVDSGDFILSLTGDFQIREWRNRTSLLNQRCGKLEQKVGYLPRMLFYTLPFHFSILEETKFFTTLKNLSNGEVLDLQLVVPPLSEQIQIVEYLDKETSLIDETVSIEERKIELLKGYKQSLISEVVTGKRKVVKDE